MHKTDKQAYIHLNILAMIQYKCQQLSIHYNLVKTKTIKFHNTAKGKKEKTEAFKKHTHVYI